MFDLFGSSSISKEQQVIKLVDDYIQRNPCEFLNPIKTHHDINDKWKCKFHSTIEEYWTDLLTLNKETFMQGWKPITNQYDTMYDQLFHYYFEYPTETEKQIRLISKHHPLVWFPPQWFEHNQPLLSGRMGQVYLTQCRLPYKTKRLVVREINLCMITQGKTPCCLPKEIIGITAARTKLNRRKLALVTVAADATLEQWIPQVDQWSFQKTFRTALMVASALREFHHQHSIHPNLQPRNVLIYHNELEPVVSLVDDWPSMPISARYGRYPYIAPEICYDSNSISQASNVYSLGVMLWQLISGVIFPSFAPVNNDLYGFTSSKYINGDYIALIKQCLSKSPEDRPTSDQVCEALVRVLMADMACPSSRQWIQQHSLEVRDKQSQLAKYLAIHHAKLDLHDLMCGASISKRMLIQVQVSLERHWHHRTSQWKDMTTATTTNATATTTISNVQPLQRVCSKTTDKDLETQQQEEEQEQQQQQQHDISRIKKKKSVYNTNKNDCCNNIYGADLPDLMQMGFA